MIVRGLTISSWSWGIAYISKTATHSDSNASTARGGGPPGGDTRGKCRLLQSTPYTLSSSIVQRADFLKNFGLLESVPSKVQDISSTRILPNNTVCVRHWLVATRAIMCRPLVHFAMASGPVEFPFLPKANVYIHTSGRYISQSILNACGSVSGCMFAAAKDGCLLQADSCPWTESSSPIAN